MYIAQPLDGTRPAKEFRQGQNAITRPRTDDVLSSYKKARIDRVRSVLSRKPGTHKPLLPLLPFGPDGIGSAHAARLPLYRPNITT